VLQLSTPSRMGAEMTDATFTFRVDEALKAAFAAMAEQQDLSAAQLLRKMMRDAVEEHEEALAHERWQRREIGDAMDEGDRLKKHLRSNASIETEWRDLQDEVEESDGA